MTLIISADSWGYELSNIYQAIMSANGWEKIDNESDKITFCKDGAFAFMTKPKRGEDDHPMNGVIVMEFDGATLKRCHYRKR